MKKIIQIILFCFLAIFFISGNRAAQAEEADKFYISTLAISDMGAEDQWHLEKIQAPSAWEESQGSRDVVVAIIDTGVDLDHPDLKNNLWVNAGEVPANGIDDDNNGYIDDVNGWNFVEGNNLPEPAVGELYSVTAVNHGTAVAGIIAAEGNNAFGGAGVAWKARIMPLRIFDNFGESDTVLVSSAIQYAIDNGADIINMSFVGLGHTDLLEAKIKAAYEKGILMVAAAGAESGAEKAVNLDVTKSYPVCHDGPNGENWVLGVAALDKDDTKADFSNYGKSCVDISAPGKEVYSTLFYNAEKEDFNRYFGGKLNGTSVAAPHVAGAAVLIKALHPNYTNKELTRVLIGTADNVDGQNPYYQGLLGGRINALKAVQAEPIAQETESEARVKYILSAGKGEEPKIWFLDSKGDVVKDFYAFAPVFKGGINLALGDVDNDGMNEIVAGAGYGGGPHIRIFNLNGELEYQFFAFDKQRRNGVAVAVGDTDGDRKPEIIAAEHGFAKPVIKIFDKGGNALAGDILPGSQYFSGLCQLVSADVNKDSKDEIVGLFGNKIKTMGRQGILAEFSPFLYNIKIGAGDTNNDGWAEIFLANGKRVREYTYEGGLLSDGFAAYSGAYGASLSLGDEDTDGEYEIITAPFGRTGVEIRVWDKNFNRIAALYPFGKDTSKNVNAYIVTRNQ